MRIVFVVLALLLQACAQGEVKEKNQLINYNYSELTDIQICDYAALQSGPRKWDSSYVRVVKRIRAGNLQCPPNEYGEISRIEIAMNGDEKIQQWSNSLVCAFATRSSPKSWDLHYSSAVGEAKRRELDCGVRSNSLNNVTDNFASWSNFDVCFRATYLGFPKRWHKYYPDAILEAKQRNLTCGVEE